MSLLFGNKDKKEITHPHHKESNAFDEDWWTIMLSVAQENERFWSVEDGNVFNLLIYIFFSDGQDLENMIRASTGTDPNCQSLTGRE